MSQDAKKQALEKTSGFWRVSGDLSYLLLASERPSEIDWMTTDFYNSLRGAEEELLANKGSFSPEQFERVESIIRRAKDPDIEQLIASATESAKRCRAIGKNDPFGQRPAEEKKRLDAATSFMLALPFQIGSLAKEGILDREGPKLFVPQRRQAFPAQRK